MDPVKQKKLPCSFGTARQFYNNRFRRMQELQLHVEVALQQALKAAAMTSLVLCHLMDGIVDRIQIQGLCLLGQVHLAGACAALSLSTHHQVLLGAVGHDLAQQLSETGCVVSLFVGIALVSLSDLGVASRSATRAMARYIPTSLHSPSSLRADRQRSPEAHPQPCRCRPHARSHRCCRSFRQTQMQVPCRRGTAQG